jgi:hypothetical protein
MLRLGFFFHMFFAAVHESASDVVDGARSQQRIAVG